MLYVDPAVTGRALVAVVPVVVAVVQHAPPMDVRPHVQSRAPRNVVVNVKQHVPMIAWVRVRMIV